MGSASNGPDWTAAIAMIAAIEAMHSCRVAWHGTTAGQAQNGSIVIALVATFATLPGSDLPKEVKVEHVWPSNAARTMEGLMYNLCWQLDYAIQKAYEQMPLS